MASLLDGSFKKIVCKALAQWLGPYVEDLDSSKLEIAYADGRATLQNLKIKKGALDMLRLPIVIAEGYIGEVTVQIPSVSPKDMLLKPTSLILNDIHVLVVPDASTRYDQDEEDRRTFEAKRARLARAELPKSRETAVPEDEQQYLGWLDTLLLKCFNNVELKVNNIHIRYEDRMSCPSSPLAAGVTLAGFTAMTVDNQGQQTFIANTYKSVVHKLASLESLAVYFDTNAESLAGLPFDEFRASFNSGIARTDQLPVHQYILEPVTGQCKVAVNPCLTDTTPRLNSTLAFEDLRFALDDKQFHGLVSMVDTYHFSVRQAEYLQYRPSKETLKANPGRPRLAFYIDIILRPIQERNSKFTAAFMKERRGNRQLYQALYTRKTLRQNSDIDLQPLDAAEIAQFDAFEAQYSYEDLIYFRTRARFEYKKARALKTKRQAEQPESNKWSAYFWSAVNSLKSSDDGSLDNAKQQILDLIGYDEHVMSEGLSDQCLKLRISTIFGKGSFALRRKSENSGADSEIVSVVFDAAFASLERRVASLETTLRLGSFSVYDNTSTGSIHRQVVRVKNEKPPTEAASGVDALKEPLLFVNFVQSPLDGHADSTVTVRVKALEVVYHKGYVEAVINFFRPPKRQLESMAALLSAATKSLYELRDQGRAALEYALDKHKTIDITLDMECPILIIPEDVTSTIGSHLVVDAGRISVRSDLIPKSELNSVRAKEGQKYTEQDFDKLETLMYDKFFLKLQDAQLVLGNDLDSCIAALGASEADHRLHLVERTTMELSVHSTIAPRAANLTRFKVSGKLPSLAVNFSNLKYKGLMRLIDIAMPDFGNYSHAPSARPANDPDPLKITSNPFLKTEDYVVEDDDHSTVGAEGESDQGYDKLSVGGQSGSEDSVGAAVHQRLFEFAFEVDKLQASLFRSTATGEDRLLADLLLERFSLDFGSAKFDMQVKLALRSLSVSMINGSRRIPLILSPEASTDQSVTKGATDLVQVKYSRVHPNSPEFMTVYEGIDQNVNVTLSTFFVHAAPEPIINLYDFIMSTFVAGHATPEDISPAQTPGQQPSPPAPPPNNNNGKIRVRVNLTKFEVALINENTKLATLDLSAANVTVYLRGNTMRIDAHLGSLSLVDDSPLTDIDPSFKKIISIDDNELADFTYESFDPEEKETFPGVNSLVRLRFASLKVTFLEGPVRELYRFLVKFARMKALYDAASQAAAQKAAEITRMKFDILIRSPVIIFPSGASSSQDVLAMKLGEIYARNSYCGPTATISAGLHGIRLRSCLWYGSDLVKLNIIDHVEISSTIVQTGDIDRKVDLQRPDTTVDVKMSDVKISLTQAQYILLIRLLEAIPRVLATGPEAEDAAVQASKSPTPRRVDRSAKGEPTVDMSPELSLTARTDSAQEVPRWSTVDVVFAVNAVRLELFDKHATKETTLKDCGIVRLSLNENTVRFKMLSDGATQTNVILKSVTINNTKSCNSKFREIIPAAQHNRNQFVLLYTTTTGATPSSSVTISIDSPKVIFAVDPVFALLDMLQSSFFKPADGTEDDFIVESLADAPPQYPLAAQSAFSLRIDLHDVSVSVLEKDDDPNTRAVQLTIEKVGLSQNETLSLDITRLGMSLMFMNKPTENVSFLDETGLTLKASGHPTSVNLSIKPIIIRASLRDINLITAIVTRGAELLSKGPNSMSNVRTPSRSAMPHNMKSGRNYGLAPSQFPYSGSPVSDQVIETTEKLEAILEGLELILIDEDHESPLFHLDTKLFTVTVTDWSAKLQADTTLLPNVRYWNISKSHWEPLIDPGWDFSVAVRKNVQTGALSTALTSHKRLDVNLTPTFLELALRTASVWSGDGNRASKSARGDDAPYRILNRTGVTLDVWSESEKGALKGSVRKVNLVDSGDVGWRFDDRKTTRECVSSGRSNAVAVQVQGKPWKAIRNIPVDREGDFIYDLRSRAQKVADRLLIEVTVKDNVKIVTLRSTYKLENQTLYPIDVVLVDSQGKPSHPLQKLAPGQDYSVPIDAVLVNDIQVRPDPGFGYGWPERPIRWQDLLRSPAQTISCPFKESGAEVPFRFQAWAMYDSNDPINRTYPKMTLRLRAPIELENLLPYGIKYTIYDKDSRKKWQSYLRRGGLMPIHCVHLDQFVLFNAEIEEVEVYKPSEFAIINTDDNPDFTIESVLSVADQQDRKLDLGISYVKHEDSGGAFRMQIYSPFIAINKTGFPLAIRSGCGKVVAGQVGNNAMSQPTAFMFSHPKEQGAEFMFRIGDSEWSEVLNFDAPSAETTVTLRSTSSQSNKQSHIGVSWTPELGKYRLSKVVTFAPRYVIKNELSREILFRECGDANSDAPLQPGRSAPIFSFAAGREPALSLKYLGVDCKWTSPVNIQDVGVIHAHMTTSKQSETDLARVEVSIVGPTIWIIVKLETETWPFTIENASDYAVEFSQTDDRQNVSADTYTVQPHSQAPFAWDVPGVHDKKLRLRIDDATHIVDIMERKDLVPFRFRKQPSGYGVVSLDVRSEGQARVLSISNYSEETSLSESRPRSGTLDSTAPQRMVTLGSSVETFEAFTEEIIPTIALTVELDGIGISMINRQLVEVVYLTLKKLKIEYTDSPVAQAINVACGWIQIDNQLHEAIFPVLLLPMSLPRDGNALEVQPALQASMLVLKDQSPATVFVKSASILLQDLCVRLDDDVILSLLDLTTDLNLPETPSVVTPFLVDIEPPSAAQTGEDTYLQVFEVQPIQISLSLLGTARLNTRQSMAPQSPLAFILNILTMTIGDVSDARLRFGRLAIEDTRLAISGIQDRIVRHYSQEATRQLHRILGSSDFVGNPIGLFKQVRSGVVDIVREPYKGVTAGGAKALPVGIIRGITSFTRKTGFGFADSGMKIIGSAGRKVAGLSFNSKHNHEQTSRRRRDQPRNALSGVTSGAEAFGDSLTRGLEGIVIKPIQGASRGGAPGFLKGLVSGIIGAIAIPAVGVSGSTTSFMQGVRNTTAMASDDDRCKRERLPRHTPVDGILQCYSEKAALGQFYLKTLDGGRFQKELYITHIRESPSDYNLTASILMTSPSLDLPGVDTIVMLSSSRVLLFKVTKLQHKWDVQLSRISTTETTDRDLVICQYDEGEPKRFIKIPDPMKRAEFREEIEKFRK